MPNSILFHFINELHLSVLSIDCFFLPRMKTHYDVIYLNDKGYRVNKLIQCFGNQRLWMNNGHTLSPTTQQ